MEWGDTLLRCDVGCAALSTRSAKSSCILCSACSFGVGRHPTTGRFGACCSEHSLCQLILQCLFGVQVWSGETAYYGAIWGLQPIFDRPPAANCGSSADVPGWPVGPTLCSAACFTSRRATRGPVAQCIRRWSSEPKIAGSIPARVMLLGTHELLPPTTPACLYPLAVVFAMR